MAKERWISLVTALVGASIVAVLFWFNKRSPVDEQYLVTNIGALFWLPMLVILLVLRQDPSAFGFGLGDRTRGFRFALLLFAGVLPFLVIASRLPSFQSYYPIQPRAEYDLAYFGYFELSYGMYLFCWEFFFRGFLLFGLARAMGNWAVFAQAVAFGIMHLGKPAPEAAASFAAGIALGLVALRSKSFLPCFLVHWASALTFDILVIAAKDGGVF